MKKLTIMALCAVALGFTACGSDDDAGSSDCEECTLAGIAEVKICDAGDGKVEITSTALGQTSTETIDLPEGTTVAQYSAQLCSGDITLGRN